MSVPDWTLSPGECWIVVGAGGTGKSSLARTIAGTAEVSRPAPAVTGMERIEPFTAPGAWISFDRERDIRAEIRRNDDSEWSGEPDEGMGIEAFIGGNLDGTILTDEMCRKLAGRGIRHLSTGEFRQVLIAREAGRNPHLAVLDEPWEGLDAQARIRLTAQIGRWVASGTLIVITVNRSDDIPEYATGVVTLSGDVARTIDRPPTPENESGKPGEIYRGTAGDETSERDFSDDRADRDTAAGRDHPPTGVRIPRSSHPPARVGMRLLEMNGVGLSYHGREVLRNFTWQVNARESWLLTGPNGSGKTTLMNLISGDEPRGYGQDIRIFGCRKGSGESTGWIKNHIGQVSAILQESISLHATVKEAVGSGLRNAMVLTEPLDGFEQSVVSEWLEVLGLEDRADTPFRRLSYGDRRLAMIGRAMVKHPPLLLLDEPMHGLDDVSRIHVNRLVDSLIRETETTVIFVSHRPDDAPSSIRRHLRLVPGENGGPSTAVEGRRNA